MTAAERNRRWRERLARAEQERRDALNSILRVESLVEAKKIAEGALKNA